MNANKVMPAVQRLGMALMLSLLIHAAQASEGGDSEKPFVYTPEFTNEFKRMKIDAAGIVVVTSNRVSLEAAGQQSHLVIYSLHHDRSLNWITEDDLPSRSVDSVITDHAVYVLYQAIGQPHQTEVAKFNRSDGSLAWRQAIDASKGAEGELLQVSEASNTLVIGGVVDDVTHVWRYDASGHFQHQWNEDLGPFTGQLGSGEELLHALQLSDDQRVQILVQTMVGTGEIRVVSVAGNGQKTFDYSRQAAVVMTIGERFSLLPSADQRWFVAYSEEDGFGIPRLHQVVLDEAGDELAFTQHENLSRISAQHPEQLLPHTNQVLSITRPNDQFDGLRFLRTDFAGNSGGDVDYSYAGDGHGLNPTAVSTDDSNQLFVVAGIQNPFPDLFADTLYIRFSPNGQVCHEVQVDGRDSTSQVQFFQGNIYELKYIGEPVANGRGLHVVKHPHVEACLGDLIFTSGFESS